MATINDSLSSAISQLGLGEQASENKKSDVLGQSEFLELMIAQLKSQDPFSPMENGDFIAQMAQFSSVTGLSELNESFESLANSLQSNQALQASSLVGRSVLVSSGVANLPTDGAMTGAINLPVSNSEVSLTIQDSSGQVVRRMGLGMQSAGDINFSWDGLKDDGSMAEPGQYYISGSAKYNGETYGLETLVSAAVDSVTLGQSGSGMTLNLSDGNTVSLSSVREIK